MMDEKDALSSDVAQDSPVTTTHDELLARVTNQAGWTDNRSRGVTVVISDWNAGDNARKNTNALRAVVELHEQVEDYCAECSDPEGGMSAIYPCPTLRAIEKELK